MIDIRIVRADITTLKVDAIVNARIWEVDDKAEE